MAGTSNNLTIPIPITLAQPDYEKLTAGVVDGSKRLSAYASRLLSTLAAGGIMVSAATIDYLQDRSGASIANEKDLQNLVEVGLKSRDGKKLVEYEIDPAFMPVVEEMAASQGVTVERLMQDAIAMIWDAGWLYAVDQDRAVAHFTRDQAKEIGELLGKETFTGADLFNALVEALTAKAA